MNNNILEAYGDEFQLSIIQAIVKNPQFFRSVREYLKPEYFTGEYAQAMYGCIVDFYTENKMVPQYDTLEYLIKSRFNKNEFTRDVTLQYLFKIKNKSVFKDEDYICQKTIDFCKRQAAIEAAEDSIKIIKLHEDDDELEPDYREVYDKWKNVLDIRLDTLEPDIVSCFDDFYDEENIRKNVRPIGMEFLDYLLDGGAGAGDLITIAAASGVGKTTACINVGSNGFVMGENVLHFTFENSRRWVARRYHSCITDVAIRKLYVEKDLVRERLLQYNGKIFIHELQAMKFTFDAIESYHNQLVDEGLKPDRIIIDSPLLLKPSSKLKERKDIYSETWKQCKGWAQSIETPVFVTAQLNRYAFGEKTNGGETMGDSIDIYRDSDVVLTIGRDDKDAFNGVANFYNAKSRFGRDKQEWVVKWDANTCKITEDPNSTAPQKSQLIAMEAGSSNALSHMKDEK